MEQNRHNEPANVPQALENIENGPEVIDWNTTPEPVDERPSPRSMADEEGTDEWHATRGDMRGEDGDFIGALGEYKKAVGLNPASPHRLTKLAEGYAAADRPHKAFDCYQRALEAQHAQGGADLPDAHMGLGDLCQTFARSAAAVRAYERAVRSRPKKPYYRWKLAVALAALGIYDKAETQLLAALELAPSDAFYRFQLADVYLLMRNDDEAIAQLRKVVEDAPRDDYYRLRLGAALLRAGETTEAVTHFEQAVQMQPLNSSYHTLLRYAYSRDFQEPAIAVEVDLVELGPYDEDFVRRIQRLSQPV